jgi:hypothetical protein
MNRFRRGIISRLFTIIGRAICKKKETSIAPQESGATKIEVAMSKKNSVTTRGKSGQIFFWSMMALPFLQFIVFYIGVNFNSLRLAFVEYTYEGNSLVSKCKMLKKSIEN